MISSRAGVVIKASGEDTHGQLGVTESSYQPGCGLRLFAGGGPDREFAD
jgi:hypothetical protein